jgi:hypothetical protein
MHLTTLGASSTSAIAQPIPVVRGAMGDWQDGHTVTVQVDNLIDPSLHLFDQFNRCHDSNPTNDFAGWSIFNQEKNPVSLQDQEPRTSKADDCFMRRNPVGLGYIYTIAGDHQEYYASFDMRLSPDFDVCTGGTEQFKIVRLNSTNIVTTTGEVTGTINLYPAIGCPDGFHLMF